MSVELIVEVLLHAPPALTPSEKLLLTVIAESCNSKTRMTWYRAGWDAAEVARRAHLTVGSLSKTFWSMAQKGCEVRVSHGTDKNGKPIFAHKGKQTTFRLPRFAPQRVDESPGSAPQRSDDDRGFAADQDAKGPTLVGVRSDDDRGLEAQRSDEDRTLLLKELPSKNPSSLSATDHEPPAANVPAQRTEREEGEASPKSKNNKPADRTTVLLAAGLNPNEIQDFTDWADLLPGGPKGDGWYIRLHHNGTISARIADWRNQPTTRPVCPECNGEEEIGDYLNRHMCNCVWFTDPDRARKAWMPLLKGLERCEHGVEGGDQRAPNGWQCCGLCRGPGWVDRNRQGRTDDRAGFTPSTSASRARQGLAVADELDRQNGHGRYASNRNKPWQPPADDDEYDRPFPSQVRARGGHSVAPGAVISAGGSVRVTHSYHPDRNYNEDF